MRNRKSALFALCLLPLAALAQDGPPGGMATAVEVFTVAAQPLDNTLGSVGTLIAEDAVVIRPELAGLIAKMHVQDGARVKAGQALFSLESQLLYAEHQEAIANLERSRRGYKRAEELVAKQLLARSEFDQAKADLGVDKARADSAAIRLAKTTIKAPFDGVIGLQQVSLGDYVQPGQALTNLVRLDPMRVDFQVPESALGKLNAGLPVRVRVDAFPERAFAGKVIAIDPQINPATRSVLVRASVGNADNALLPGLFARVELVLAQRANALLVPERALWPIGAQVFVFRVVDGKAQQVQVRVGERLPGQVEIRSGLSAGDVIVTAGQPKLYDGAAVAVAAGDAQPAPTK